MRHGRSRSEFGGIANPSVLPEHSTRRDGPATIAATINASGERASAIAEPLALGLREIKMPSAAWSLCRWTSRRGIASAKGFEVCNAVSAARMAVEVHRKKIAAPQLDAGHRFLEGAPQFLDLLGILACGLAPSRNRRPFVQFLGGIVPRDDGWKDEAPSRCGFKCDAKVLIAHGRVPGTNV